LRSRQHHDVEAIFRHIDSAKREHSHLRTAFLLKRARAHNDAAGWAALIARLRGFAIAAIGLEASGGYLLAAGLPACQVNPRGAWSGQALTKSF